MECSLWSGCAVDKRRVRVVGAPPVSSTGRPGGPWRAPPRWCRRIAAFGALRAPRTCQHTNAVGGWTAPRTSGAQVLRAHEAAVQLRVAGGMLQHAGHAADARKLGVVSQLQALGVPRGRTSHMNVLSPFRADHSWNHPKVPSSGGPMTFLGVPGRLLAKRSSVRGRSKIAKVRGSRGRSKSAKVPSPPYPKDPPVVLVHMGVDPATCL